MTSNSLDTEENPLTELLATDVPRLSADFLSLELVTTTRKMLNFDLLRKLKPKFCSIPWLGDSNDKVNDVDNIPAILMANELMCGGYTVLLHLAGNDYSGKQMMKVLEKIKSVGLNKLFAIQGNFSTGKPNEFTHANQLVTFIKKNFANAFCVGVAGYPAKHPAAESVRADLKRLKDKIDCGAEFIITQAVFEYASLESFYHHCKKLKINVPIIPAVFVVHSCECIKLIPNMCKIPVPQDIITFAEQYKDSPKAMESFGIEMAAKVVTEIFESRHFRGVHIFTLNRLDVIQKLYEKLGL